MTWKDRWNKLKVFIVINIGDPRELKGYEKKSIIHQGFMNDRDIRFGYELINKKTNKVFYRKLGDDCITFWKNENKGDK